MDNDKFNLLISILENLEKEDINKSNLEGAIIRIINHFDDKLTKDQKKEVLKEFVRYEKARQEKTSNKKIINEDEKNRQLLESFLAGETFDWGA